MLYANGFGPTSTPVVSGSETQSGTFSAARRHHRRHRGDACSLRDWLRPASFSSTWSFRPTRRAATTRSTATYSGAEASPAALITVQGSAPAPTSVTFYVAPNGNDFWSGTLPAPNSTNTDGPFATFDHARAFVQSIAKAGLTQVNVQFRAGTYFLPATEMFTAADSGSATMQIVYQNYPGESPVISGGVRVQNWTNTSGNTWKTTLPASTQYFENLFYNGVRRLRPRLGVSAGYFGHVLPDRRSRLFEWPNAPPPPATAPNANCSVYFAGSGWECFDRFQYSPTDPIASTWKNLAPPAGNPCGQPAGNPALAGDIELLDFEQVHRFQAAHQLRGHNATRLFT